MDDVFKALKEKKSTKNTISKKLSFRSDGDETFYQTNKY